VACHLCAAGLTMTPWGRTATRDPAGLRRCAAGDAARPNVERTLLEWFGTT
jgi:hypothetical protein